MNNITSEQIELFLTVATCKNISLAAKLLYISQPAASFQLRRLEESIGKQLLIRSNRGVELSREGERLFAELDPIYNRYRIALNEVLGSPPSQKRLAVGCLHLSGVSEVMYRTLREFRRGFPDIDVQYEFYNLQECRDKLLCRQLDAAFMFNVGPDWRLGLETIELTEIEQFFIVPKSWEIDENNLSALSERDLIVEVSGEIKRQRGICDFCGIKPNIRYESSLLVLLNSVADGKGFTIGGNNLPRVGGDSLCFIPVGQLPENLRIKSALAWAETCKSEQVRALAGICRKLFKNDTSK